VKSSWCFWHGVVLGLPLVVIIAFCIAYTARVGKMRLWWRGPRPMLQRLAWATLLAFAWLAPLSGMMLMYAQPDQWMTPQQTWQSLALPWMASWGMIVPLLTTACVDLTRRAQRRAMSPFPLQRARWLLMGLELGIVLLAALLGSMTSQGMFYP